VAPFLILFLEFALFWGLEFMRLVENSNKYYLLAEYGSIDTDGLPKVSHIGKIN